MKHYGISQWVDLARGLVPEADGEAMRRHLAEGCAECRDLAGFCEKVRGVCADMAGRPAPDWVVRNARAIFPFSAQRPVKRAVRIAADLIYDSFLVPAAAGLRATWQVGWQGLYRAGEYSLDLRIEPDLASSRAAVIGQISNHILPTDEMENVQVYLKAGRSVIAETRSNRFGEFQMEYEQQGRLQLCVYLDGGSKCFQAPLKRLAGERHSGTERLGFGPGANSGNEMQ